MKKENKVNKSTNKEFLRWMSIFIIILSVFVVLLLILIYFRNPQNVLPYTKVSLENMTILGNVIDVYK